jgi:PleD family two-component response regulator
MMNKEDRPQEGTKSETSRILNKDQFLYLLDLEVKRARRYQNFLSILFLKFIQCSNDEQGKDLQSCHQALNNLLMGEMRETDILGSLGENKLVVLLPYADVSAGDLAKSRFVDTLKYYDFRSKGYEVEIDQICFPINGTDTIDLIKKALET